MTGSAALAYAEPPPIVRRHDSLPQAQGAEGQSVDAIIASILRTLTASRQWQDAAAFQESDPDVADETLDVFSLNRVPPKRTYTMRVKYKFIGRGQPRPYPLDDEE